MATTETCEDGTDGDPCDSPTASLGLSNSWHSSAFNSADSCGYKRWKHALVKMRSIDLDPWLDFHTDTLPRENAVRHRYSALKKKWVQDSVEVYMENLPFDHGAMRECFRLKKLPSTGSHTNDIRYASNYVAKSYINPVDREVYFDDVRLQMETKMWAEEYNKQNPPKKVDVFQLSIVEFPKREGSPLYHIERYMDGNYRKYNSNSGFVDQNSRSTPQAFSHFTFEQSGHRLLVVDIQGVGDLYTDPQMHTATCSGPGDGDLGPRGMALFFRSHRCNALCAWMELEPFDLHASEAATEEVESDCSLQPLTIDTDMGTVVRPRENFSWSSFGRDRVPSGDSGFIDPEWSEWWQGETHHHSLEQVSFSLDSSTSGSMLGVPTSLKGRGARTRTISEASDLDGHMYEDERLAFHSVMKENHRPACANHPSNQDQEVGQSVLGQIHYELARLHESGRFNKEGCSDVIWPVVLYHTRLAAELGCLDALVTMTNYSLRLTELDILHACPLEPTDEDQATSVDYLIRAAESGHCPSGLMLAERLDKGVDGPPNWAEAVRWYERVVEACDDPYKVWARIGEMCAAGGHGLEKDTGRASELYTVAAEAATLAMNGRLATKYYLLAEEFFAGDPAASEL